MMIPLMLLFLAAQPQADASGLEWVEGDTFLAVHDSKRPEELGRPRVSLVHLRRSSAPVWTPLDVKWPEPEGPSHDLESIARVPGSDTYLLAESGDDGASFRRIFMAELAGSALRIKAVLPWPVPVRNVEGIAVARAGRQLVFIFAERAHGLRQTEIAWAVMNLDPPSFGRFEKRKFANAEPLGAEARPVSALAVDRGGRIYAAAALDPGDEGPFRSAVWRIGSVGTDKAGQPQVELRNPPELLATLDGVKVESLTVRELQGQAPEIFIGTDDESHGALVRPLKTGR